MKYTKEVRTAKRLALAGAIALSALMSSAYYDLTKQPTYGMTAVQAEKWRSENFPAKINLAKPEKFYTEDALGNPYKQAKSVRYLNKLANLGKPTQAFPPERIGQKKLIDIYWGQWKNNQVRRGMGLDPIALPVICVRESTLDLSEKCSSLAGYGWKPTVNGETQRKDYRKWLFDDYGPPKHIGNFVTQRAYENTVREVITETVYAIKAFSKDIFYGYTPQTRREDTRRADKKRDHYRIAQAAITRQKLKETNNERQRNETSLVGL